MSGYKPRYYEDFEKFRPFNLEQWKRPSANHMVAMGLSLAAAATFAFFRAEAVNGDRVAEDTQSSLSGDGATTQYQAHCDDNNRLAVTTQAGETRTLQIPGICLNGAITNKSLKP